MVLDVGPVDFDAIVVDFGRSIQKTPRSITGSDGLGNPTYTSGAPSTIQAVVQDIKTSDRRIIAGILVVGDKEVFVTGANAIGPTDTLTIDGQVYRVVDESSPSYGDAPVRPYRSYVVRRVPG